MYKIGFIGCGNMSKAMIAGMVKAGVCAPGEIVASNRSSEKLKQFAAQTGIAAAKDNLAAANAKYVVLAVKPFFYQTVIDQIRDHISDEQVIVTIAPGATLAEYASMFGREVKLVRTMPNTPALVGEGMTAYIPNALVDQDEVAELVRLFGSFGNMQQVEERYMDAVVCVSGSSPAYVYMFMEAMADAAVLEGMPRDVAYRFAAQAVLGSAKMLLETGKHPGQLKDEVCSPGGTTIEAVKVLEQRGMRGAVMEAMHACALKCKK